MYMYNHWAASRLVGAGNIILSIWCDLYSLLSGIFFSMRDFWDAPGFEIPEISGFWDLRSVKGIPNTCRSTNTAAFAWLFQCAARPPPLVWCTRRSRPAAWWPRCRRQQMWRYEAWKTRLARSMIRHWRVGRNISIGQRLEKEIRVRVRSVGKTLRVRVMVRICRGKHKHRRHTAKIKHHKTTQHKTRQYKMRDGGEDTYSAGIPTCYYILTWHSIIVVHAKPRVTVV